MSATRPARAQLRAYATSGTPVSFDHRDADRGSIDVAAAGGENCLISVVTEDLTRNFCEPITLRDIECATGYSVYQIIRTFRRRLGTTPHAYLMRMRIDYAAMRLAQGESIAGAAAEAGFSDQSHMTRHFKRAFGTTPGQYVLAQ
jgi:AraC-like DNA-binding protein